MSGHGRRWFRRVQVRTALIATAVVAITLFAGAAALVVVQREQLVSGLTQLADQQSEQLAGQVSDDGPDAADLTQVSSSLGDRALLQVLVENAERHGSGAVTVRLREAISGETSHDVVAVDVLDEGEFVGPWPLTGIDGPDGGHGIGLPMAQRLATQARGRVVLTARRPTTVTLFAPRATN